MCGAQFTWEREMFVDFSIPFGLSGIRLLTGAGGLDGTPDSLVGKRVGVITGSLGEATIKALQPKATLSPVATIQAGIAALKAGRIDAMAGDSMLMAAAARSAALAGQQLVPTIPYNRYAVGCIMPENNSTLRNLVNLALAQMVQGYVNGVPRYTELVNRWLGPGSSVGLPEEMIKRILPDRAAQPRTDSRSHHPLISPCRSPAPPPWLASCWPSPPSRHRRPRRPARPPPAAPWTWRPDWIGSPGPPGPDRPHTFGADPKILRQFPSGQLTAGFINGRYRGAYRGPAGRAFANSRGYYGGNSGFINGGGGYRGGGFVNRPYGRSFVNW